MADSSELIQGQVVLLSGREGAPLCNERDASEILSGAFSDQAQWVVLPAARLHEDFFKLRTLLAGTVAQRFANYRVGLAILGEISEHLAASATWSSSTSPGRDP